MDTGWGTSHTRACKGLEGQKRDTRKWGSRGGIALGEISNVNDGVMNVANHHGTCIPM